MPATPDLSQPISLAFFRPLPPGGDGQPFDVHFNPASLQYTVSNTLKEEGSGSAKKQYVDKTSAKLTMQLVFDTTDTGEDVRVHTDKMAKLLKPVAEGQKQVPPNVEFGWGVYSFTGLVEQYKENIDFFSAGGVPLRATVDITLASQDVQFESRKNPSASVDGNLTPEPAVVPGSGGPTGVANALGDPRAARAIASANGSASLRFGAEAGLAIGAGIDLRAEAAFSTGISASAGAGLSMGGGLGAGLGGGIGIGGGISGGLDAGIGGGIGIGAGLSGGVGIGAGVSVGAGVSGGVGLSGDAFTSSSFAVGGAGISGSAVAAGGFAGLRITSESGSSMPGGRALFSANAGASAAAVGGNAQFGIGGKVQTHSSNSLGADVSGGADLNASLRFG